MRRGHVSIKNESLEECKKIPYVNLPLPPSNSAIKPNGFKTSSNSLSVGFEAVGKVCSGALGFNKGGSKCSR